jgi:hypothetical protein
VETLLNSMGLKLLQVMAMILSQCKLKESGRSLGLEERQRTALGALKRDMFLQIAHLNCSAIFAMLTVIMSIIGARSSSFRGRLRTLWATRLRG